MISHLKLCQDEQKQLLRKGYHLQSDIRDEVSAASAKEYSKGEPEEKTCGNKIYNQTTQYTIVLDPAAVITALLTYSHKCTGKIRL